MSGLTVHFVFRPFVKGIFNVKSVFSVGFARSRFLLPFLKGVFKLCFPSGLTVRVFFRPFLKGIFNIKLCFPSGLTVRFISKGFSMQKPCFCKFWTFVLCFVVICERIFNVQFVFSVRSPASEIGKIWRHLRRKPIFSPWIYTIFIQKCGENLVVQRFWMFVFFRSF